MSHAVISAGDWSGMSQSAGRVAPCEYFSRVGKQILIHLTDILELPFVD